MLAVVAASSVVSALPLPHPQLSESEFRSFPDDMEEAKHNKVVISSGYSNVGGMNIEFCIQSVSLNQPLDNQPYWLISQFWPVPIHLSYPKNRLDNQPICLISQIFPFPTAAD